MGLSQLSCALLSCSASVIFVFFSGLARVQDRRGGCPSSSTWVGLPFTAVVARSTPVRPSCIYKIKSSATVPRRRPVDITAWFRRVDPRPTHSRQLVRRAANGHSITMRTVATLVLAAAAAASSEPPHRLRMDVALYTEPGPTWDRLARTAVAHAGDVQLYAIISPHHGDNDADMVRLSASRRWVVVSPWCARACMRGGGRSWAGFEDGAPRPLPRVFHRHVLHRPGTTSRSTWRTTRRGSRGWTGSAPRASSCSTTCTCGT